MDLTVALIPQVIAWVSTLGVAVFALSGAIYAAERELDILGFILIGTVTFELYVAALCNGNECESRWQLQCVALRTQFVRPVFVLWRVFLRSVPPVRQCKGGPDGCPGHADRQRPDLWTFQ